MTSCRSTRAATLIRRSACSKYMDCGDGPRDPLRKSIIEQTARFHPKLLSSYTSPPLPFILFPLSIFFRFTCSGRYNTVTGGTGLYECATGYEEFTYSDDEVVDTTLYLCFDKCPELALEGHSIVGDGNRGRGSPSLPLLLLLLVRLLWIVLVVLVASSETILRWWFDGQVT